MIFAAEPFTREFYREVSPLLKEHYEEIAHFKDIPLEPNVDQYLALAENGTLKVFTARDTDFSLVGYVAYFVNKNIHYMNSLQAVQDVLFVSKEKRGFGGKFLDWCDQELKKIGVEAVYQHVKKAHDFSPLLKSMNYELVDLVYARRL